MKQPDSRWLTFAEAADLLAVDVRTIKRWMRSPKARNALGAVRHGKQWRIPQPDDENTWESQTDDRLMAAAITSKSSWQRGLEKQCRGVAHYELESYRLWLAAYSQLSAKGPVTKDDLEDILLLWQTACKILESLPRRVGVDKFKSQFPDWLEARHLPDGKQRIRRIMSLWPNERCLKEVRAAHSLDELEKIRRGMDTMQAVQTCKNLGKEPTAENLRPLLHKDFKAHINDTREDLPKATVKATTPDELRNACEAELWQRRNQIQTQISKWFDTGGDPDGAKKVVLPPSLPMIDTRQPQNGLKLRTFRNRHPLKKSPQRNIIAAVYEIQDSIPDADEKPTSGKTPIRDSKLSDKSD